jgi:hypothetical protein
MVNTGGIDAEHLLCGASWRRACAARVGNRTDGLFAARGVAVVALVGAVTSCSPFAWLFVVRGVVRTVRLVVRLVGWIVRGGVRGGWGGAWVLAAEAFVPCSANGALFELEVAGDLCSALGLNVLSLIDQQPVVTNDQCLWPQRRRKVPGGPNGGFRLVTVRLCRCWSVLVDGHRWRRVRPRCSGR